MRKGKPGESKSEQIGLFRFRVDRLGETRLIRDDGLATRMSLNIHYLDGMNFGLQQPNEDDLRSFLMEFRHFFMQDSQVHLHKIYNICHMHLTSDELRERLRESRNLWNEAHKSAGMRLVWNGQVLTPEYVTNLWINGFYFHSDTSFINVLRLIAPYERMLIRYWFLYFLIEATRQVFFVGNVVTFAIRQGHFDEDIAA